MRRTSQMSDSIELGVILALTGGFMDAYSYICRGHVFANAQTGNILLLGVNLSERNFGMALQYLFPIVAFVIGIIVANGARWKIEAEGYLHWRQLSVLCEAIVLVVVCFLPQSLDLLANSLTSLACGIQVESFRKIHGNGIATTMCIGNLRSGTENLCDYWHTREKGKVRKCMLYYGIIFCFVAGAILGNIAVTFLHEKAIVFCSLALAAAFFMMFSNREAVLFRQDVEK